METASSASKEPPCCKVHRVLQRYGIEDLDSDIQRRWTREDGQSASLRELTRELNREILRSALVSAGITPVDGEAENLRRIFTDDTVGENRRVEAKRRLERDGVAVDELLDNFVSHQTVHNHLRSCKGVSSPAKASGEDRVGMARSTIFGLQSRTETVTEQTLAQLGSQAVIEPAEFDVLVDIQAICEECGRSYGVEEVLSDGGCDCAVTVGDQE